jgi:hypothetical protein
MRLRGGAPAWRPPSWLAAWRPTEPVPVGLADLDGAIGAARGAAVPADPVFIAVELDRALMPHRPLPANWAEMAPAYLEALEDAPADLVLLALKHIRTRHRIGFPKPGDISAVIDEALAERRSALRRLELARSRWKPPAPPLPQPTAEQLARAGQLAQDLAQRLRASVPLATVYPRDERPRTAAESIRRVTEETSARSRIPLPGDPAE